jgi:hypothetical protein
MENATINRSVRSSVRQTSRRREHSKKKAEKRTGFHDTNDFLKQVFQPYADGEMKDAHTQEIEKKFFESLEHLTRLYDFDMIDHSMMVYPYNIYACFKEAEKAIQSRSKDLSLFILADDENPAFLATAKELTTGTTLYYVPVEPLHTALRNKDNRKSRLLLSVFSYLYQIAGMPFFDGSSYIGSTYDMMEEWFISEPEEWDEETFKHHLQCYRTIRQCSKTLRTKISDPVHVRMFQKRLHSFVPVTKQETNLYKVATRIYELYMQFPDRGFMDRIYPGLITPEDDESIYVEQYFSFYWSDADWLNAQLMDVVNCDLQERGSIDQPVALQLFDKPQTKIDHDINYEKTLLDSICELADALNEIEL